MSERFRLPDEALPSQPPPPPSTPLGNDDATPAVGTATAHIPIPEKIKLLNAALRTPHGFVPAPVAVPAPQEAVERAEAKALEAPAASVRPAPDAVARPTRRRHIINAVALFVILVGATALALRLCADFLFR